MPDPTPQQLIADPRFHALPVGDRISALVGIDPDFARLNPADRIRAMSQLIPEQKNFSAMRPQDLASQAMADSGITGTQRLAPTAPRVNMQESPNMAAPSMAMDFYNTFLSPNGSVGRFHKAVEQDLGGAIQGVGGLAKAALTDPRGPIYGVGNAMVAPIVQSANDPKQSKSETAGTALGVNAPAIKEAAQDQDYASILGHSVLPLVTALMGGAKASELMPERAALTPAEAGGQVAKIVTDTVNPPPKSMAGFQKSVESQLPEVLQGKTITNRAELGNAFAEHAAKARQAYYDTYINPIKDASAYGGKTIGQLDARLSEINATLKPTYEKGGAAAQAALSAESKAQLTAEAAGIRNNMNQAIADKLNVPVEQVAAARQKFGQMYDVADKIQLALNKERYSANQAAKQQPNLEITAAGLANKGIQTGFRRLMGHPADRALRNALENYSPSSPGLGVDPNVSPASVRPAPPTTSTVELNPRTSSAADIQAVADRLAHNSKAIQQRNLPYWQRD